MSAQTESAARWASDGCGRARRRRAAPPARARRAQGPGKPSSERNSSSTLCASRTLSIPSSLRLSRGSCTGSRRRPGPGAGRSPASSSATRQRSSRSVPASDAEPRFAAVSESGRALRLGTRRPGRSTQPNGSPVATRTPTAAERERPRRRARRLRFATVESARGRAHAALRQAATAPSDQDRERRTARSPRGPRRAASAGPVVESRSSRLVESVTAGITTSAGSHRQRQPADCAGAITGRPAGDGQGERARRSPSRGSG